jgi:hypothetical protein
MTPSSSDAAPRSPGAPSRLVSVKYSLAELLSELDYEKANLTAGPEHLPQAEIAKLFKNQPAHRASPRP